MNHNPPLLTPYELSVATDTEILAALYQYIVSATSLLFAGIVVFGLVKALLWLVPRYWNLERSKK